jgi:hypothetical protein
LSILDLGWEKLHPGSDKHPGSATLLLSTKQYRQLEKKALHTANQAWSILLFCFCKDDLQSRSLSADVTSREQIESKFDDIAYKKGASIYRSYKDHLYHIHSV